jgi:hypothetical protein
MRSLALVLILAITQSALIAADAPAPLKPFVKTQLTPAQLATCAAFKSKSGKDRLAEAHALSDIFLEHYVKDGKPYGMGHPGSLITRDDITGLLGKADSTLNDNLSYIIDDKSGSGWNMDIAFDKEGHLNMIIFIN